MIAPDHSLAEQRAALRLIEDALDLLDRSGAPADIGAHLDLARCRLNAVLAELDDQNDHRGAA